MPVAVNRHRQSVTLDPHSQSDDITRRTFVLREVSADDNPRGIVNISVQRYTPVLLAKPLKDVASVAIISPQPPSAGANDEALSAVAPLSCS